MERNKLGMYFIPGAVALAVVIVFSIWMVRADGNPANIPLDQNNGGAAEPTLGAVSSPDIASPYLSFGGVRSWANGSDLRTGTSTLCAIQSPAATSTLVAATLRMDSLPFTLEDVAISRASTAFASTTLLAFKDSFTISELGYLVATTSVTALVDGIVLPNSFINFRFATTTAGINANFAPTGKCSVVFREI